MNRRLFLLGSVLLATACSTTAPVVPPVVAPINKLPPPKPRIGIALGGGAVKGFTHIGVLKALEAAGLAPDVVSGTSAGSLVGALYASGMSGFALQEESFIMEEAQFRDLTFGGGGLVKGEKLQDFVNQLLGNRPFEKLPKPFAAVAAELNTGNRTVFRLGNVGQAVRASCSIPGVFQPAVIAGKRYVDGGVVSPVPVDAAREMGADIVIAVDISAKAQYGKSAEGMASIMNQAVIIMGQKLGELELARADIVVRPKVSKIGSTDFESKHIAVLEGERAMQAMMPELREKIAKWQEARLK